MHTYLEERRIHSEAGAEAVVHQEAYGRDEAKQLRLIKPMFFLTSILTFG